MRLVEAGQFGTLKTISQGINLYIFVRYEKIMNLIIKVLRSGFVKNGRDL